MNECTRVMSESGLGDWRLLVRAGVGHRDVVLDACCGTGTILVGSLERGARTLGFDQSFKFATGTRANLDHFGFASVGAGALRSRTSWTGVLPVAALHHLAARPHGRMRVHVRLLIGPDARAELGKCLVGQHDARESFFAEFPSMPLPTVAVCNVM